MATQIIAFREPDANIDDNVKTNMTYRITVFLQNRIVKKKVKSENPAFVFEFTKKPLYNNSRFV